MFVVAQSNQAHNPQFSTFHIGLDGHLYWNRASTADTYGFELDENGNLYFTLNDE